MNCFLSLNKVMVWVTGLLLLNCITLVAQVFPQQVINAALANRQPLSESVFSKQTQDAPSHGIFSLMKFTPSKIAAINSRLSAGNFTAMTDTIFVGEVPNDTLIISGTFFNNGPVLVFNDGVLIFDHANATFLGDIFVFQNGKLFCDSSIISSPQQYFYQRSLTIANNGYVNISNSTLDYGGLSHNLAVVHNGSIVMTNINNIGFTTAGAYGNASITIDSTNQAGEFIMTDSSQLSFNNAHTVLLWHHIPDGAVVDVAFPNGASVSAYAFNNSQPGVAGIGYDVQVTNCTDVMWALMPENGSDVTVSGSTLRAIGLWFVGSDTVAVSGLVNNSNYSAFTAPLSDRNLQLNTTSVQTWSIYLFNQTVMNITGCIVGEVGTMGTSYITAQGILCDGSGGYYWGTDTTLNIAVNTTVLGYIRSQGNGIVLLGYGSSTSGASATGNSVMVVTQSSLPQDPIAYEHGIAWRVHINPPQNLFVDTIIDISGSAWVDQGPLGSFMDFGSYTMEYAPAAIPGWISISPINTNEVHNNLLSQWDTHGLTPGNYLLRLNTVNDLGDSIDAVIQVTLLPSILGVGDNPGSNEIGMTAHYEHNQGKILLNCEFTGYNSGKIQVMDVQGKLIYESECQLISGNQIMEIPFYNKAPGNYFVKLFTPTFSRTAKVVVGE